MVWLVDYHWNQQQPIWYYSMEMRSCVCDALVDYYFQNRWANLRRSMMSMLVVHHLSARYHSEYQSLDPNDLSDVPNDDNGDALETNPHYRMSYRTDYTHLLCRATVAGELH